MKPYSEKWTRFLESLEIQIS